MGYELTEEQMMLRRGVRNFMEKECPLSMVRKIEYEKQGYSPELYAKMAQAGYTQLGIPQEYGGQGGDWIDLCLFSEEVGRVLLPSPYYTSVVVGGQALLAMASAEQKTNLLPRIAKGEIIMTLAATEPTVVSAPFSVETTATQKNDGYDRKG